MSLFYILGVVENKTIQPPTAGGTFRLHSSKDNKNNTIIEN
jgi:hypothetical protein